MFKINNLTLYNKDKSYKYTFKNGINYFKGENSSGKTVFYNFLDYMFGSSENLNEKPWFEGTLDKAEINITYENINIVLVRTLVPDINYLYYEGENANTSIDLIEYKNKLNSIFARDEQMLRKIREFAAEELTYRTFTMFNFLGEKRQGIINNFFDKCSDIKYSIKLPAILNFIFNGNLERIYELKKHLNELSKKKSVLENENLKFSFVCKQINDNIQKLGLNINYDGYNNEKIKYAINEIKNMNEVDRKNNATNIAQLETIYNNISEQIKTYESAKEDVEQFEKYNKNRQMLLNELRLILEYNKELNYLVEPLDNLLNELEDTISFSQYMIKDNTIEALKSQKEKVKNEIKKNDARFKCYTLQDKQNALAVIENCLDIKAIDKTAELSNIIKEIKSIKEELKVLENSNDTKKIDSLSSYITNLYKKAQDISSVVKDDTLKAGFEIKYIKNGNILQPMIKNQDDLEKNEQVNYYIGSMARHTLMQLCGYFGFLDILLKDKQYPIIPVLIIDHISKSFDIENAKAIGKVINSAVEQIGEEEIQVFMFDNKEFQELGLKVNNNQTLIDGDKKTGFNPFFFPAK